MNIRSDQIRRRGLRFTALVMVFVFTATSVTWTTPALAATADVTAPIFSPIDKLAIPSEMGTLQKTFLGTRDSVPIPINRSEAEIGAVQTTILENKSKVRTGLETTKNQYEGRGTRDESRFVVLIQDAHAVIDAQENIAKILGHLGKTYGVRLAALEGAKGRLEPILFRTFPDSIVKRNILAGYENRAELSGPEMASALQEEATDFRGMEDWGLYEQNYFAYLRGQEKKDGLLSQWNAFKKSLDDERDKIYDTKLSEFEEARENFLAERAALLDLLVYLSNFKSLLKAASGYQELPGLIDSIGYEKSGKQEALVPLVRKIADEFKIKYLRGLGVKTETNFYNRYQAFMTGQITAGQMLQYLVQLGHDNGNNIKLTLALKKLLGHAELLSGIRGSRLYDELQRFLPEVEASLIKTPAQKKLAEKYQKLFLLKEMIELELTHEALAKYQKEPDAYLGLIDDPAFKKNLAPALEFYQAALLRDQAFMEKINAMMKDSNQKTVAVVAGGFHTKGLERILKEKGVSYAVVTPKIASLEGIGNYAKVMKGDVSFKDYLKTTYFDALMRHAAKALTEALPLPDRVRTLKLWRDNVIRELAKEGRIAEAGKFLPYIDELLRINGEAVSVGPKHSKEEILDIVRKELEKFKKDSFDKIWKTFEYQLDIFTGGLKDLVAKKELTTDKVSALLDTASRSKPSMLALRLALDPLIKAGYENLVGDIAGMGGTTEQIQESLEKITGLNRSVVPGELIDMTAHALNAQGGLIKQLAATEEMIPQGQAEVDARVLSVVGKVASNMNQPAIVAAASLRQAMQTSATTGAAARTETRVANAVSLLGSDGLTVDSVSDQIMEVFRSAVPDGQAELSDAEIAESNSRTENLVRGGNISLVMRSGSIVGYIIHTIDPARDRGYVNMMAVHKESQGLNIGTALMDAAGQWFKERNVPTVLIEPEFGSGGFYNKYFGVTDFKNQEGKDVGRRIVKMTEWPLSAAGAIETVAPSPIDSAGTDRSELRVMIVPRDFPEKWKQNPFALARDRRYEKDPFYTKILNALVDSRQFESEGNMAHFLRYLALSQTPIDLGLWHSFSAAGGRGIVSYAVGDRQYSMEVVDSVPCEAILRRIANGEFDLNEVILDIYVVHAGGLNNLSYDPILERDILRSRQREFIVHVEGSDAAASAVPPAETGKPEVRRSESRVMASRTESAAGTVRAESRALFAAAMDKAASLFDPLRSLKKSGRVWEDRATGDLYATIKPGEVLVHTQPTKENLEQPGQATVTGPQNGYYQAFVELKKKGVKELDRDTLWRIGIQVLPTVLLSLEGGNGELIIENGHNRIVGAQRADLPITVKVKAINGTKWFKTTPEALAVLNRVGERRDIHPFREVELQMARNREEAKQQIVEELKSLDGRYQTLRNGPEIKNLFSESGMLLPAQEALRAQVGGIDRKREGLLFFIRSSEEIERMKLEDLRRAREEFQSLVREIETLTRSGGTFDSESLRKVLTARAETRQELRAETRSESRAETRIEPMERGTVEYDENDRIAKISTADGRVLLERSYTTSPDNETATEITYIYDAAGALSTSSRRTYQTVDGVRRNLAAKILQAKGGKWGRSRMLDPQRAAVLRGEQELGQKDTLAYTAYKHVEQALQSFRLQKQLRVPEIAKNASQDALQSTLESFFFTGKGFIKELIELLSANQDLDPTLPLFLIKARALSDDRAAQDEIRKWMNDEDALKRYLARSYAYLSGEKGALELLFQSAREGMFADNVARHLTDDEIRSLSETVISLVQKDPDLFPILFPFLRRIKDDRVPAIVAGYLSQILGTKNFRDSSPISNAIDYLVDHKAVQYKPVLQALREGGSRDVKESATVALAQLGDRDMISVILGWVRAAYRPAGELNYELDFWIDHLASLDAVEALPVIVDIFETLREPSRRGLYYGETGTVGSTIRAIVQLGKEKLTREKILPLLEETILEMDAYTAETDPGYSDESYPAYYAMDILDALSRYAGTWVLPYLQELANRCTYPKLIAAIDSAIQTIRARGNFNIEHDSPDAFEANIGHLASTLDIMVTEWHKVRGAVDPIEYVRKKLQDREDLRERLIDMILRDAAGKDPAMRLLALFPEDVQRLFAQTPAARHEALKEALLEAILENHMNGILSNYSERYLAYGNYISLKEKNVVYPEVDTAFLMRELLTCGIVIDAGDIERLIRRSSYFRLAGSVVFPKLAIMNVSYRGSRMKEAEDARYSTKAITVGLRYRGGERGQATGTPSLYEWDNQIMDHIGAGTRMSDPNVALAFYYARTSAESRLLSALFDVDEDEQTRPVVEIRKRSIPLIDKFDFEAVKVLIAQQEIERTLKKAFFDLLEKFMNSANAAEALQIFGKKDTDSDTMRNVVRQLKTQAGLLPEYISAVYGRKKGHFDAVKAQVGKFLAAGDLAAAKAVLKDSETVRFLTKERSRIQGTIEDPAFSFSVEQAGTQKDENRQETRVRSENRGTVRVEGIDGLKMTPRRIHQTDLLGVLRSNLQSRDFVVRTLRQLYPEISVPEGVSIDVKVEQEGLRGGTDRDFIPVEVNFGEQAYSFGILAGQILPEQIRLMEQLQSERVRLGPRIGFFVSAGIPNAPQYGILAVQRIRGKTIAALLREGDWLLAYEGLFKEEVRSFRTLPSRITDVRENHGNIMVEDGTHEVYVTDVGISEVPRRSDGLYESFQTVSSYLRNEEDAVQLVARARSVLESEFNHDQAAIDAFLDRQVAYFLKEYSSDGMMGSLLAPASHAAQMFPHAASFVTRLRSELRNFSVKGLKAVVLATALLAAGTVFGGQNVKLAWNPSVTNMDGTPVSAKLEYKVYSGTSSKNYTTSTNVGSATTATISGLTPGTHYFSVTAVDPILKVESGFAEELVYTTLPELKILSSGWESEPTTNQTAHAMMPTTIVDTNAGPATFENMTVTTNSGPVTFAIVDFKVQNSATNDIGTFWFSITSQSDKPVTISDWYIKQSATPGGAATGISDNLLPEEGAAIPPGASGVWKAEVELPSTTTNASFYVTQAITRSESRDMSRRGFLGLTGKAVLGALAVAALPGAADAAVASKAKKRRAKAVPDAKTKAAIDALVKKAKALSASEIKRIAAISEARITRTLDGIDALIQEHIQRIFPEDMRQQDPAAFQQLRQILLAIIHHESVGLTKKIQMSGYIAVGISQTEAGPGSSKTAQDAIGRYLAFPDTPSRKWNETVRQNMKRYLAGRLGLPGGSLDFEFLTQEFVRTFGAEAEDKLGLILSDLIIQGDAADFQDDDDADVFFALMKVVRQLSGKTVNIKPEGASRQAFFKRLNDLTGNLQNQFVFYDEMYRGKGFVLRPNEKHPLTNDLQIAYAHINSKASTQGVLVASAAPESMAPTLNEELSAIFGGRPVPANVAAPADPAKLSRTIPDIVITKAGATPQNIKKVAEPITASMALPTTATGIAREVRIALPGKVTGGTAPLDLGRPPAAPFQVASAERPPYSLVTEGGISKVPSRPASIGSEDIGRGVARVAQPIDRIARPIEEMAISEGPQAVESEAGEADAYQPPSEEVFLADEAAIAEGHKPKTPSVFSYYQASTKSWVSAIDSMFMSDNSFIKGNAYLYGIALLQLLVTSVVHMVAKRKSTSNATILSTIVALWATIPVVLVAGSIFLFKFVASKLGFEFDVGEAGRIAVGSVIVFAVLGVCYFAAKIEHRIHYGKTSGKASTQKRGRSGRSSRSELRTSDLEERVAKMPVATVDSVERTLAVVRSYLKKSGDTPDGERIRGLYFSKMAEVLQSKLKGNSPEENNWELYGGWAREAWRAAKDAGRADFEHTFLVLGGDIASRIRSEARAKDGEQSTGALTEEEITARIVKAEAMIKKMGALLEQQGVVANADKVQLMFAFRTQLEAYKKAPEFLTDEFFSQMQAHIDEIEVQRGVPEGEIERVSFAGILSLILGSKSDVLFRELVASNDGSAQEFVRGLTANGHSLRKAKPGRSRGTYQIVSAQAPLSSDQAKAARMWLRPRGLFLATVPEADAEAVLEHLKKAGFDAFVRDVPMDYPGAGSLPSGSRLIVGFASPVRSATPQDPLGTRGEGDQANKEALQSTPVNDLDQLFLGLGDLDYMGLWNYFLSKSLMGFLGEPQSPKHLFSRTSLYRENRGLLKGIFGTISPGEGGDETVLRIKGERGAVIRRTGKGLKDFKRASENSYVLLRIGKERISSDQIEALRNDKKVLGVTYHGRMTHLLIDRFSVKEDQLSSYLRGVLTRAGFDQELAGEKVTAYVMGTGDRGMFTSSFGLVSAKQVLDFLSAKTSRADWITQDTRNGVTAEFIREDRINEFYIWTERLANDFLSKAKEGRAGLIKGRDRAKVAGRDEKLDPENRITVKEIEDLRRELDEEKTLPKEALGTDKLTGLSKYGNFQAQALKHPGKALVMLTPIDYGPGGPSRAFHAYQTLVGYKAGNRAIQKVAKIFRETVGLSPDATRAEYELKGILAGRSVDTMYASLENGADGIRGPPMTSINELAALVHEDAVRNRGKVTPEKLQSFGKPQFMLTVIERKELDELQKQLDKLHQDSGVFGGNFRDLFSALNSMAQVEWLKEAVELAGKRVKDVSEIAGKLKDLADVSVGDNYLIVRFVGAKAPALYEEFKKAEEKHFEQAFKELQADGRVKVLDLTERSVKRAEMRQKANLADMVEQVLIRGERKPYFVKPHTVSLDPIEIRFIDEIPPRSTVQLKNGDTEAQLEGADFGLSAAQGDAQLRIAWLKVGINELYQNAHQSKDKAMSIFTAMIYSMVAFALGFPVLLVIVIGVLVVLVPAAFLQGVMGWQVLTKLETFAESSLPRFAGFVSFFSKAPPRVDVRTYARDGRGYIEIRDNGRGISLAVLRAFEMLKDEERFETLDSTKKIEEMSRGNGLILAYKITKFLGGEMKIDTRTRGKDRGTTVTLSFPLAARAEIRSSESRIAGAGAPEASVVSVIDDINALLEAIGGLDKNQESIRARNTTTGMVEDTVALRIFGHDSSDPLLAFQTAYSVERKFTEEETRKAYGELRKRLSPLIAIKDSLKDGTELDLKPPAEARMKEIKEGKGHFESGEAQVYFLYRILVASTEASTNRLILVDAVNQIEELVNQLGELLGVTPSETPEAQPAAPVDVVAPSEATANRSEVRTNVKEMLAVMPFFDQTSQSDDARFLGKKVKIYPTEHGGFYEVVVKASDTNIFHFLMYENAGGELEGDYRRFVWDEATGTEVPEGGIHALQGSKGFGNHSFFDGKKNNIDPKNNMAGPVHFFIQPGTNGKGVFVEIKDESQGKGVEVRWNPRPGTEVDEVAEQAPEATNEIQEDEAVTVETVETVGPEGRNTNLEFFGPAQNTLAGMTRSSNPIAIDVPAFIIKDGNAVRNSPYHNPSLEGSIRIEVSPGKFENVETFDEISRALEKEVAGLSPKEVALLAKEENGWVLGDDAVSDWITHEVHVINEGRYVKREVSLRNFIHKYLRDTLSYLSTPQQDRGRVASELAKSYRYFSRMKILRDKPQSKFVVLHGADLAKLGLAIEGDPRTRSPNVMAIEPTIYQFEKGRRFKGNAIPPEKLVFAKWKGRTFLFYTSRTHSVAGVTQRMWRHAEAYLTLPDGGWLVKHMSEDLPENVDDLPAELGRKLDEIVDSNEVDIVQSSDAFIKRADKLGLLNFTGWNDLTAIFALRSPEEVKQAVGKMAGVGIVDKLSGKKLNPQVVQARDYMLERFRDGEPSDETPTAEYEEPETQTQDPRMQKGIEVAGLREQVGAATQSRAEVRAVSRDESVTSSDMEKEGWSDAGFLIKAIQDVFRADDGKKFEAQLWEQIEADTHKYKLVLNAADGTRAGYADFSIGREGAAVLSVRHHDEDFYAIRVEPEVSDQYDGIATTLMSLVYEIARLEGAKEVRAEGVRATPQLINFYEEHANMIARGDGTYVFPLNEHRTKPSRKIMSKTTERTMTSDAPVPSPVRAEVREAIRLKEPIPADEDTFQLAVKPVFRSFLDRHRFQWQTIDDRKQMDYVIRRAKDRSKPGEKPALSLVSIGSSTGEELARNFYEVSKMLRSKGEDPAEWTIKIIGVEAKEAVMAEANRRITGKKPFVYGRASDVANAIAYGREVTGYINDHFNQWKESVRLVNADAFDYEDHGKVTAGADFVFINHVLRIYKPNELELPLRRLDHLFSESFILVGDHGKLALPLREHLPSHLVEIFGYWGNPTPETAGELEENKTVYSTAYPLDYLQHLTDMPAGTKRSEMRLADIEEKEYPDTRLAEIVALVEAEIPKSNTFHNWFERFTEDGTAKDQQQRFTNIYDHLAAKFAVNTSDARERARLLLTVYQIERAGKEIWGWSAEALRFMDAFKIDYAGLPFSEKRSLLTVLYGVGQGQEEGSRRFRDSFWKIVMRFQFSRDLRELDDDQKQRIFTTAFYVSQGAPTAAQSSGKVYFTKALDFISSEFGITAGDIAVMPASDKVKILTAAYAVALQKERGIPNLRQVKGLILSAFGELKDTGRLAALSIEDRIRILTAAYGVQVKKTYNLELFGRKEKLVWTPPEAATSPEDISFDPSALSDPLAEMRINESEKVSADSLEPYQVVGVLRDVVANKAEEAIRGALRNGLAEAQRNYPLYARQRRQERDNYYRSLNVQISEPVGTVASPNYYEVIGVFQQTSDGFKFVITPRIAQLKNPDAKDLSEQDLYQEIPHKKLFEQYGFSKDAVRLTVFLDKDGVRASNPHVLLPSSSSREKPGEKKPVPFEGLVFRALDGLLVRQEGAIDKKRSESRVDQDPMAAAVMDAFDAGQIRLPIRTADWTLNRDLPSSSDVKVGGKVIRVHALAEPANSEMAWNDMSSPDVFINIEAIKQALWRNGILDEPNLAVVEAAVNRLAIHEIAEVLAYQSGVDKQSGRAHQIGLDAENLYVARLSEKIRQSVEAVLNKELQERLVVNPSNEDHRIVPGLLSPAEAKDIVVETQRKGPDAARSMLEQSGRAELRRISTAFDAGSRELILSLGDAPSMSDALPGAMDQLFDRLGDFADQFNRAELRTQLENILMPTALALELINPEVANIVPALMKLLIDTLTNIKGSLTIGLDLGTGKDAEIGTAVLAQLIKAIGERSGIVNELAVSGKLPGAARQTLKSRGINDRPIRPNQSFIPINPQDAVPLVMSSNAANGVIHQVFYPIVGDRGSVTDTLVNDYANLLEVVAAIHCADIISRQPNLLKHPELLKAELLKTLFRQEQGAVENLIQMRAEGRGFTISSAAVKVYLEMMAKQSIDQAA